MSSNPQDFFETKAGFCSDCGSILPLLTNISNGITCFGCKRVYPIDVYANTKVKYTIHFNSVEATSKNIEDEKKRKEMTTEEDDGPILDRKCPKCDNEKMSYATLQLRSADEGQTVFYTCTKCKFKESENS